jgi:60 kDa SS-A/Ro ribonucleoprotein
MKQWMAFKQRNPQAKMICIDIQPNGTTQARNRSDIINVGGFSDHVFQLIADVANGRFSQNHWVNTDFSDAESEVQVFTRQLADRQVP